MKWVIESSPHLQSPETVPQIMVSVFAALVPAGFWGVFRFGMHSAFVVLTSVAGCVLLEFISQKWVFKTTVRIGDGSAALTGLLMAYCLPPDMPLWQVLVGCFFAIFIAKECFGGLGNNLFNPALVGRAVLLTSFPVTMTRWQIDGVTQASPLGIWKESIGASLPSYGTLFVGGIPGSIGETSKLLLIAGGLFLLARGIISWHVPVSTIGSVFVLSIFFRQDPVFQVLSGGLILGAVYMATDTVTGPLTARGKLIFGFGCGLLTVCIRNLGSFPEGVCYAILIMNMLVPLIDRFTRQRIYGKKT